MPLREHLASLHRQTGVLPDDLANAPDLPSGCEHLWADFIALHECRGSSGFGPLRIGYRDIQAWQDVTGIRLADWQLTCIRRADVAFMESLPKPKEG